MSTNDTDYENRIRSIENRIDSLEKQAKGQTSIWVERFMYWIIVIALIVAIILMV